MNIDQIQINENQNSDANINKDAAVSDNVKKMPANVESASFKQEILQKLSKIDFLSLGIDELSTDETYNSNEQQTNLPEQKISGAANKMNHDLIKNLQQFALKNKIPFRIKDANDVKLMMHSQNIFTNDKQASLKVEKIEQKDIDFLKTCIENPNMLVSSVNPQTMTVNYVNNTEPTAGEVSYKSLSVSKTLTKMIDYAYKTQKPVRLDFEGDSSVILKIDVKGKLTAEFISSNKAMENLLKENIPYLRNKLDSEGISYNDITYREQSHNNRKYNQQEENSYE